MLADEFVERVGDVAHALGKHMHAEERRARKRKKKNLTPVQPAEADEMVRERLKGGVMKIKNAWWVHIKS